MGAATEGVAENTGSAADAAGDLADNTQKAGKAAKGALAAFDELNVLQMEQPGGSGGGADSPGAGLGGLSVGDPKEIIPDALMERVQKFKEDLLAFFAPLQGPFERLKKAILDLGGTIWDGLKWAWENILVPLGTWLVQQQTPRFLDLIAAAVNLLNEALKALAPLGQWLFDNFLKPAAEWTGQAILDALQWLTDRLNELSDWIKANPVAFQIIMGILALFAAAIWIASAAAGAWAAIGALATTVTAAFGAAVAFLASPIFWVVLAIIALIAIIVLLITHWDWVKQKAGEVWTTITQIWMLAGYWFRTNVTEPLAAFFDTAWRSIRGFFADGWNWVVSTWQGAGTWFRTNVTEPVKNFFDTAWRSIRGFFADAWSWVLSVWQGAGNWFQTNVTSPIANFFKVAWTNIRGFFADAWDHVVSVWEGAGHWFSVNVIDPIKNGFETALDAIKTKWETVFGGFKDFTKNAMNGVISMINGMLAAMAAGINAIIGALNSIQVKVPDWVPGIGGSAWSVAIPNVGIPAVPYLATGAVIPPNAAFLAVLGDQRNGTNIEAPADLIRQLIREELDGAGGDVTVTMPVYLDGEKIYENQKRVSRRRGSSLVTSGGMA